MKINLVTVLFFIISFFKSVAAQSPFNYGQTKEVYFVSTERRISLGIDTIYIVDGLGSEGSMGENWDVFILSFDSYLVLDNWYCAYKDPDYKYDFQDLINKDSLRSLNGFEFDFEEDRITGFGGEGYGSFEWNDVFSYDTVSLVYSHCSGHCADIEPVLVKKNVFSKNGCLLYSCKSDLYDSMEDYGTDKDDSIALTKVYSDTTYFNYDDKGLYIGESDSKTHFIPKDFTSLFNVNEEHNIQGEFHQCYIGKMTMENYIQNSFGYQPDLILFEIYRQCVFSFVLNKSDGKYYSSNMLLLE